MEKIRRKTNFGLLDIISNLNSRISVWCMQIWRCSCIVGYLCIWLFVIKIHGRNSGSILFSNVSINICTFKICNFESVGIFISLTKSEVRSVTLSAIYIVTMLENNKFNLKKTWQILKDIIGKSKPGTMNNKFLINGTIVQDSKVIANAFNDFYINIVSNLAGKIKPNNPYINPTSFIKKTSQIEFLLRLQLMRKYFKKCWVGWFNTIPAHTNIF